MALTGNTNAERIWNYCKAQGLNDCGCAGLMGNLDCESGLNPKNLQDSCEARLGYTNETYTAAVDNGNYAGFIKDSAGYGLAQWTWWTRKQNLLSWARSKGTSIGDLEMQLGFLFQELTGTYSSVLNILKTATTVAEASNAVLLKFECPLDSGASVQAVRLSYSQKYYSQFAGKSEVKKSMGYITVSKKSGTKLSEHFTSDEFDCHGSGCCSTTLINETLVEYLEKIRAHFGKPITITSGYRCTRHNASVRGETGSRHSKGDAADIVVQGTTPRAVAQYAESIGILGIGLYETSADGYFTHIDTRNYKSFWYGQSCAARTTFGGTSSTSSSSASSGSTSTSTLSTTTVLACGSKGAAVKQLQVSLIALGYSCGEADGIYGSNTAAAVKKFQSANGLSADGIAGYLTLTALQKAVNAKNSTTAGSTYTVKVSALNIRKGAGTNYPASGLIRDKGTYTITEEAEGKGANKWGKLADGRGWIALDYCVKG